ncbi:hypothetical protein [Actinoplanes awajinensis]|uniref:hypothetical protein n=1 Tax=Actinoplanes awajinensis TaxID=135946 RepID=UPI00373FCE16
MPAVASGRPCRPMMNCALSSRTDTSDTGACRRLALSRAMSSRWVRSAGWCRSYSARRWRRAGSPSRVNSSVVVMVFMRCSWSRGARRRGGCRRSGGCAGLGRRAG